VRKYLNLPDIAPATNPSPAPDFSFFGGTKKLPPGDPPSERAAKLPESVKAPERRISSSAVMSQRIRNLEKQVKGRNKAKKR